MSNVIKAYSVRYDNDGKKTIDTNLRIVKEIEARRIPVAEKVEPQEGFVEGLNALFVETLPSEEEHTEKAAKIIEDAQKEAAAVLENAQKEAEKLINDTLTAAQNKGYEDGIQKAKQEAVKQKAEYDEKSSRLQKEYEEMTQALEPQMAQIIISLVEKLTGSLAQDKDDVILYLIDKSLKNIDKSNEYTIKVSESDYEFLSTNKEVLMDSIGKEASLHIISDSNLSKNQCLIETDLKVINCSLDIQLNGLITDLKLISGM